MATVLPLLALFGQAGGLRATHHVHGRCGETGAQCWAAHATGFGGTARSVAMINFAVETRNVRLHLAAVHKAGDGEQ